VLRKPPFITKITNPEQNQSDVRKQWEDVCGICQKQHKVHSVFITLGHIYISVFCYGKATLHSWCIVVDVTVNNIKPFSGAMDMQEWVPVALLLSYKIFCTVVSNVNLGIYVNCPILLRNFKTNLLVSANDVGVLGT